MATKGGYELAPHYDLLSTGAWSRPEMFGAGEAQWPDIAMSYPISAVLHYKDLRREHFAEFAKHLGMGPTSFKREFNKLVGGIEAAAELAAAYEARTDVPPKIRGSQIRMLLSIRHLPISTMSRQLQQQGNRFGRSKLCGQIVRGM